MAKNVYFKDQVSEKRSNRVSKKTFDEDIWHTKKLKKKTPDPSDQEAVNCLRICRNKTLPIKYSGINITDKGRKHLGAVIGTPCYKS